jgi:cGMP-dependent protein kinase
MKKQKFKPNEYIIEENTEGDQFYLIIKGRVRITVKGNFVRDLDSGDCLGENTLLTDNIKRTASAMALEKVLCYVLSKSEFQVILSDNNTREYLMKKLALQDTEISLSSLNYIKFLGKGKFGTVSLVHNKKNIYAIKAISRKSVEKEKILAKYFVNERKIMLSLDHPFVVKMVKSMKNQHFCFLLIEYINGSNLDQYLSNREHKQNIYETQFYIGSMLLMLDYLQKKYIAHRDIKPSNIMIDYNGYLKMIDFGTAKILTDYTSTIIGTPHYIAPEILQGRGYSSSCDFWSLGICMYEIFYGRYPFGNYANEVIEIYKEILKNNFTFPNENARVENVNNFIKCLLNKKVNERICNVSSLKKKPFFEGFEFDKLNDFKLKAPFKPSKHSFDKYLKETNPYENYVKEDNSVVGKKRGKETEEIPTDYDPNWADEF